MSFYVHLIILSSLFTAVSGSTPITMLPGELIPTLSEEMAVTSPERNVKQDADNASHGLPIFASRNINRLKDN